CLYLTRKEDKNDYFRKSKKYQSLADLGYYTPGSKNEKGGEKSN
ncbi:unnamed protein product, partial [marine sediment metagenome]